MTRSSGEPPADRPLDPVLLRTFLAVADRRSFSQAGRALAIRQSTVSDHIQRLEDRLKHRLFDRDTHSVALTRAGEALVPMARSIIALGVQVGRRLDGLPMVAGALRVGLSGALAGPWLAAALRRYVEAWPGVDLRLTLAGAGVLAQRFDAGELDLLVAERWPGDARGTPVWREALVWLGQAPVGSIPLVLPPPPSLVATKAVDALERAGVSWQLACTSDRLAATLAAVEAGLGVAPLPRRLVPRDMRPIADLPALGSLEVVALHRPLGEAASGFVAAVADASA